MSTTLPFPSDRKTNPFASPDFFETPLIVGGLCIGSIKVPVQKLATVEVNAGTVVAHIDADKPSFRSFAAGFDPRSGSQ